MTDKSIDEMTVEELDLLIEEKNKQINALKKIQEKENNIELDKFQELTNLIAELAKTRKLYYDNRTLLGFALPDELSDEDWEIIETQMPILEKKIEYLEKLLNEKVSQL